MRLRLAFLACILALPGLAMGATWKIESAALMQQTTGTHLLKVSAMDVDTGRAATLVEPVHLDSLTDSFVVGDRFVALGGAGRAQAVVVLNLQEEKTEDWFYCYEPRRINDDWVVYVEYYPSQGAGEPTDVVLVYDVKEGPSRNRLPISRDGATQKHLYPIQVGLPLFPASNVEQRSYQNVADSAESAYHVLGPPFFTYLSANRLAFVATQGRDMASYRNYLVVVDIARGIGKPIIRTFEFPREQFKRFGEYPNFIRISAMKQIGDNSVQLEVPEDIYGVKYFTMAIH